MDSLALLPLVDQYNLTALQLEYPNTVAADG